MSNTLSNFEHFPEEDENIERNASPLPLERNEKKAKRKGVQLPPTWKPTDEATKGVLKNRAATEGTHIIKGVRFNVPDKAESISHHTLPQSQENINASAERFSQESVVSSRQRSQSAPVTGKEGKKEVEEVKEKEFTDKEQKGDFQKLGDFLLKAGNKKIPLEEVKNIAFIFPKIISAINNNYTYFIHTNNKKYDLRQLVREFLKNEQLKDAIAIHKLPQEMQNSKLLASTLASPMLSMVNENLKYRTMAKHMRSWDPLPESRIYITLNNSFKELIEKKPYDGNAMFEFIKKLPNIVEQSKRIMDLENRSFGTIAFNVSYNNREEIDKILNNIIETENIFIKDVNKLLDELNTGSITNDDERKKIISYLLNVKTASTFFTGMFQNPKDKNSITTQLLAQYYNAYSPKNMKKYLEPFFIITHNYEVLKKNLNKMIKKDFYKNILIKISQRPLFHLGYQEELIKNLPLGNDAARAALEHNVDYLRAYEDFVRATKTIV